MILVQINRNPCPWYFNHVHKHKWTGIILHRLNNKRDCNSIIESKTILRRKIKLSISTYDRHFKLVSGHQSDYYSNGKSLLDILKG